MRLGTKPPCLWLFDSTGGVRHIMYIRGTLEPSAQAGAPGSSLCVFQGMEGEVWSSQPAWRVELGWGSPASHI